MYCGIAFVDALEPGVHVDCAEKSIERTRRRNRARQLAQLVAKRHIFKRRQEGARKLKQREKSIGIERLRLIVSV